MTNTSAIIELNRMKTDKSHTGAEYNAIMKGIEALEKIENAKELFRKWEKEDKK